MLNHSSSYRSVSGVNYHTFYFSLLLFRALNILLEGHPHSNCPLYQTILVPVKANICYNRTYPLCVIASFTVTCRDREVREWFTPGAVAHDQQWILHRDTC